MARSNRRPPRRLAVPAALLASALLAASGVAQTTDSCTSTGSANGGAGRDVICGTSGADTMNGNAGNDELRGEFGGDLLNGGTGDDDIFGDPDDDTITGGDGNDHLEGGSGSDGLAGGPGNDFFRGGSGNDTLTGGTGNDRFFADSGNDFIRARDGELDNRIDDCGTGHDTLDMDLVDSVPFFGLGFAAFADCEAVNVGAVNEGPNVVISRRSRRVNRDGRTTVRLTCPRSLTRPSRCRGNLKLQLLTRSSVGKSAPRSRYSIRPGQSSTVPLVLSRSDAGTFRNRRRIKGLVTSAEVGQHGRKTTVQTIGLRGRA